MRITRRQFVQSAAVAPLTGPLWTKGAEASNERLVVVKRQHVLAGRPFVTIGAGLSAAHATEGAPGSTSLIYAVEPTQLEECLREPLCGGDARVIGRMRGEGSDLTPRRFRDSLAHADKADTVLVIFDAADPDATLLTRTTLDLCRRSGLSKTVALHADGGSTFPACGTDLSIRVLSPDWDFRDPDWLHEALSLADAIRFFHRFAEAGGIVGVDYGDLARLLKGMRRGVFASLPLRDEAPRDWRQAADFALSEAGALIGSPHAVALCLQATAPNLWQLEAVLAAVEPNVWNGDVLSGVWQADAWPHTTRPTLGLLALSATL